MEEGTLRKVIENSEYSNYVSYFVQRKPKYTIKGRNGNWKTKNKPLADPAIAAHLMGKYAIGCISPWYPEYGALDFDGVPRGQVYACMEELGLSDTNSLLCTSERKGGYHLLFRPLYNGRPQTTRCLHMVLDGYCLQKRTEGIPVELFPQSTHTFRLPFGPKQRIIHRDHVLTHASFDEKLFWFEKLNEFDLADDLQIPSLRFDRPASQEGMFAEGKKLYETGLVETSSRNSAQFAVLYSLWRENIPADVAIDRTWNWIRNNHNDLSKEIRTNPQGVKKEIERQVHYIWEKYDRDGIYPDVTHNAYTGYLTTEDLITIVQMTNGALPEMKFLGALVGYCNVRQNREAISVHSKHLIEWSSKDGYIKRLERLEERGILRRESSYSPQRFAKTITLNWKYRAKGEALEEDGR